MNAEYGDEPFQWSLAPRELFEDDKDLPAGTMYTMPGTPDLNAVRVFNAAPAEDGVTPSMNSCPENADGPIERRWSWAAWIEQR